MPPAFSRWLFVPSSVDDVKVAEFGVLQPDSHYSPFMYVVYVCVGNFVELVEEVGVDECEYACGVFRVVGPEWGKKSRRIPRGHTGFRGVCLVDAQNVRVPAEFVEVFPPAFLCNQVVRQESLRVPNGNSVGALVWDGGGNGGRA